MASAIQQQQLINSIKLNDADSVRSAVDENPRLCSADAKVRKGDSPLHLAATLGFADVVCALLTHTSVHVANNDGKTALHEAALHGHEDVITVLLKNNAEIDCLKAADWTPLMLACAKSHIGAIKELITAGASLSLVNKDGWNAFHIAAREGDVAVVKYLLDHDSNCWQTESKNRRTPLHSAVIHGRYECAELLLSGRCAYNVNAKDSCGSTPLMDALRKGFEDVAQLLHEHGASPTICNSLGRNCFHVVAEAGVVKSLQFLVSLFHGDVKTYLNLPDSRGTTCLHLAAKEGHVDMIQALLELKVDLSNKDSMGRTALMVAMLCKKIDCVKKLESWPTKPDNG